jgi:ferredoxin
MRVEVDVRKCVASGQCALIAPEVFDQRDDAGVVVLLDEQPAPELLDLVRESALVWRRPSGWWSIDRATFFQMIVGISLFRR